MTVLNTITTCKQQQKVLNVEASIEYSRLEKVKSRVELTIPPGTPNRGKRRRAAAKTLKYKDKKIQAIGAKLQTIDTILQAALKQEAEEAMASTVVQDSDETK